VACVPGPSHRWRVECDLGAIPLNAGSYVARVYVGDGLRDVARFSNAFVIHVIEHDVFGWGNKLPPVHAWGAVYWAPRWAIRPSQDTDSSP
jgi:hypothetical protein